MNYLERSDFTEDELIAAARYVANKNSSSLEYYLNGLVYEELAHDENGVECDHCGVKMKPSEVHEFIKDGKTLHLCRNCASNSVMYICPICGRLHINRGRFEEITAYPEISERTAIRLGLDLSKYKKKSTYYLLKEDVHILSGLGLSDEAIHIIEEHYGDTICPECAEKYGIHSILNENQSYIDGVFMNNDHISSVPIDEEIKQDYYSRMFTTLGIKEYASRPFSDKRVTYDGQIDRVYKKVKKAWPSMNSKY